MKGRTDTGLFVILLLALTLRLYHLTYPYLDHHSWRQTDTAAIARNFYRGNFNILRPQMDRFGVRPSTVELEFQVTPFLTALLYRILGVKDWVGRIVPILFSLGSIVYFYRLVALHFDVRLARFSSFVFAILPLNVFFSRVLMPEAGALFFTIAAVYYFSAYLENTTTTRYVLAIAFSALAFLSKLSNLYILIVIAALALLKYHRRLLAEWRLLVFLILTLAPTVGYYSYMHMAAEIKMMPYQVGMDKWGSVSLWTNPALYQILFHRFRTIVFTELGLALLAAGVFFHVRSQVFRIWLVAAVTYVALVANGNFVHSYYQLPLIPAGAFFIGLVLERTYSSVRFRSGAAVLGAALLALALRDLLPMYGMYAYPAYEAARAVNAIDPSGSPIVSVPDRSDMAPELLYYADRRGWVIWPDQLSRDAIAQFRAQGAKYIVIMDYNAMPDDVKQYIARNDRWKHEQVLISRL